MVCRSPVAGGFFFALVAEVCVLAGAQPELEAPDAGFVGKRYPPEAKVVRDAATGRHVTFLTTSDAEDDKIYQTHPSWTGDGKHIVFRSNRTGSWQLFVLEEKNTEIVQVTASKGIETNQVCLSRKDNTLITFMGNRIVLIALDPILARGERDSPAPAPKELGRIPPEAELSGTASWDASEKTFYLGLEWPRNPLAKRWSIHKVDLARGRLAPVLYLSFRVGHIQANPLVSGLIMYCHETGGDAPQRTWVVRADGSDNRPFYRETYNEWVTHELWWDRARALFTIWPGSKEMAAKSHGIASVDLTGNHVVHSQFAYWHVSCTPNVDLAVADTFTGDIFRVDLKSGKKELLTQGHRRSRRGLHPHPSLSREGDRVLFVSHLHGSADLALTSVAPIAEKEE